MAEDKNAGWVLASFALGAILGAALALMLTPQTGKEARERLKDVAEKAKEIAIEKAKELLEEAKERIKKEGEGKEGMEVEVEG